MRLASASAALLPFRSAAENEKIPMPYSSYRPDLMGSATLMPGGSFEAGSLQSFELVFVAGTFGIDDTRSIKIGFRFATDFGPVQFADPCGQGFTTAEASNGATLELRWEYKRNIRPWSRSLYIGVTGSFLRPGDTVTVRFGDRRQGSPGIRLQTYCEEAFEFRLFVDAFATYDFVPLRASPRIAIVPGPVETWRIIAPTCLRMGTFFRAVIIGLDKWGNVTPLPEGTRAISSSRPIAGLPASITLKGGTFAAPIERLTLRETGELVLALHDPDGRLLCRSNPLLCVPNETEQVHFWGDLHGQSCETLGTNSAQAYFEYGRDRAFVDVIGHQANDFQITDAFWRELNRLTHAFEVPGTFICIPGYEWSGNTALGGDRNVYFRHEGNTIRRSSHAQLSAQGDNEVGAAYTAEALFRALDGIDCVTIAHVGGRYADVASAHDGKIETAVEIHSGWGTFEWLLHDVFEQHHRVGIVSGSDGHKGRPGAEFPGASFFGATGGLTCFLAPQLDRDAIFEALRRRHHYCTTGNRCYLHVQAEFDGPGELFLRDPSSFDNPAVVAATSVIMGDIARTGFRDVDLTVHVLGSAAIERLEIFDGLDRIETIRPYQAEELGRRIRVIFEGAEQRGRSRATVWDGALTVDANQILSARMINVWNREQGITGQSSTMLSWRGVTTGNLIALDLWLSERDSGALSIVTRPATLTIPITDIDHEDLEFDAGGLGRRIRLVRLPDTLEKPNLALTRRIALRERGDTRLFVKLTQIDGHQAWSSPIYLFRHAL
jgi:hypothetical protein